MSIIVAPVKHTQWVDENGFPTTFFFRLIHDMHRRAGGADDGGVVESFITLGPPTADGQFIVATGAGAFQFEADNVARTSLGLGTGDSPTFTGLTATGNVSFQGNTVIGNASGDSLTIHPSAVTWSNNPTHSGDHTFSGAVTVQGAFTSLGIDDNATEEKIDITDDLIDLHEAAAVGPNTGPTYVTFDGSSDYMLRGGALTGAAAGKVGTIACRIRLAGSNNRYILNGTDGSSMVISFLVVNSTNLLQITIDNVAGNNPAVFIVSSTAYTSSDGWLNILASWDCANDTEGQLYVNDASDYDSATSDLDNEDLGYAAATNWAVGSQVATTAKFNGDMDFLYVNFAAAVDFDVEANRRLFFDANGFPVDLGATGSVPTGTAPIIYLNGVASSFVTNKGTGGGFTLTGSLVDGSDALGQVQFAQGGIYTDDATSGPMGEQTFNSKGFYQNGVYIPTISSTSTLTNKTIDSADNTLTLDLSEGTLSGTMAEFDTACSDGDFAFQDENASFADLASTGNTTIGDGSGDSLTLNAGTWTLGSNYVATRAAGTVAAGVVNLQITNNSATGDAGGTSAIRSNRNTLTLQGTNNIAQGIASSSIMQNSATSGTTAAIIANVFSALNTNVGAVTSAIGCQGDISVIGAGNIASGSCFVAASPALSSTGAITTLRGLLINNLGHATLVTNAFGVDVVNFTASATLTASFRSQQNSGTGVWGFLASGTANNAFNGPTKFGATTVPVNTVDINGSLGRGAPVTKTGDFTLAATENWVINNKSGSACVVTLPAASSWTGREVMIKNIQAQTVDSASSNVVPLDGGSAGTAILSANAGRWATLVSDGTSWVIMQGVI